MSAEVAIVEVVFVRKFQMAGDFTARFSYCSSCHVSNVSFLKKTGKRYKYTQYTALCLESTLISTTIVVF